MEKGGVQDGKGKMTTCYYCHQPITNEDTSEVDYARKINYHTRCDPERKDDDMKIEEIKTLLEAAKKILESIEKKVGELG